MGDAHPFTATAGTGFDHHRIADLISNCDRFIGGGNHADMAGNGANPGLFGQFFRFDFIAHRGDGAGWRADKGNIGRLKRGGERRLFR